MCFFIRENCEISGNFKLHLNGHPEGSSLLIPPPITRPVPSWILLRKLFSNNLAFVAPRSSKQHVKIRFNHKFELGGMLLERKQPQLSLQLTGLSITCPPQPTSSHILVFPFETRRYKCYKRKELLLVVW